MAPRNELNIHEIPQKKDTQLAALASHYVYFYLDLLEYLKVGYYSTPLGGANKKSSRGTISSFGELLHNLCTKGTIEETIMENLLANKEPLSSPLQWANKEKILFRVINRIMEVLKITGKSNEKKKEIIINIFNICFYDSRPIGFYQFYNICGYWDYWAPEGGDDLSKEEAKKWNVCHGYSVYINDLNRDRQFSEKELSEEELKRKDVCSEVIGKISERVPKFRLMDKYFGDKENDFFCYREEKFYYNLYWEDDGINTATGYGALLFIRNDHSANPQFILATKGTDVNSFSDWFQDVTHGLTGFLTMQHEETKWRIRNIDKDLKNCKLTFVGHSLGGALASYNAIMTEGRHAVTFNAAGANFIGTVITRLESAVSNLSFKPIMHPLDVPNRVHPIRIKGEAIDLLMIVAKYILTANMCQRGYGIAPLIIDLGTWAGDAVEKHGINNFLYDNIMRQLECPVSRKRIKTTQKIQISHLNDTFEFEAEPEKILFWELKKEKMKK